MASVTRLDAVRSGIAPRLPDFLEQHVEDSFRLREAAWPPNEHILVGASPDPNSLVLQSNDYLCMGSHPAVQAAAAHREGASREKAVMAAVFLQRGCSQDRFERSMAQFMRAEATVLTQSGWKANVGLLQSLGGCGNVYLDMFAHASLAEGVISGGSRAFVFRHNCVRHLESLIERHGPGVVAVDSVYSTCGSVAPLVELVELCERTGCALLVDESHSLGTHGPEGAGLVVGQGLEDRVHFRTASLAKAFAGRAGIVACSARVAEFVGYHSRPAVFSSAVLPSEIAVLEVTKECIRAADARRARLHRNAAYLREGLLELGYNVEASQSQIFGLVAGEEWRTIALRNALESRGLFGSVFCAPATPKNRSLVRLTLNCEFSLPELDRVIAICADVRSEVRMDQWRSSRRLARRRELDWPLAANG